MKKVAIIHDWLVTYAGAERVLSALLKLYPRAELFSLIDFFHVEQRKQLLGKKATVSSLQRWPFASSHYPYFLPWMPRAIERFNLSAFDLVISSSSAVAKGVLTAPDQPHLCYCHSPMRYIWDQESSYAGPGIKGMLTRQLFHKMRLWDVVSSNRVDAFAANSTFVQRRIEKCYRRSSTVIHPPVSPIAMRSEKQDFYLTVSRLVPYKRIDLLVEAFNQMPSKKLIIIGDGPERNKLMKQASKNTTFLGNAPRDTVEHFMQNARCFLFAGVEDFGIAMVEAQSAGTPLIAYRKGGAVDIMRENTGLFFEEQTSSKLIEAISRFELQEFSAKLCAQNASRFSPDRFASAFAAFVEDNQSIRNNDENRYSGGWKRNKTVAPFEEELSQTVP